MEPICVCVCVRVCVKLSLTFTHTLLFSGCMPLAKLYNLSLKQCKKKKLVDKGIPGGIQNVTKDDKRLSVL